jgi:hypothetical protein
MPVDISAIRIYFFLEESVFYRLDWKLVRIQGQSGGESIKVVQVVVSLLTD